MLSNTATPKYYARFREAVLSGAIPVSYEVSLQMKRIDELIASPVYYYDDSAIDGFIEFCESELTITDGRPIVLLDSFKLWAEDLLAWFYYQDTTVPELSEDGRSIRYVRKQVLTRLRNKQYLIVGRGAAKSVYESIIHAYYLVIDPETTQQITTAPTMKQAEEVMSPIRTAIAVARGPLFKLLTMGSIHNTTGSRAERQQLASVKDGIRDFVSNSLVEIRPMSIDRLNGLRCKVSTVDEWLSGDIRENVIECIEEGASKLANYVIVATSSEGTVRNGPGDDIKLELTNILKGDYFDPHTSIWWYKLDSIDEVGDPRMWLKANPNIGYTVQWEVYQRAAERAEKVPSARNEILAKRFGIPMEGYTYFFTYEETVPHKHREFWGMPCAMGADMSQGDDFCSFTLLFPLQTGEFGVKTRNYITERTYSLLPAAMRSEYDKFLQEGSLIIMGSTVLDMVQVEMDMVTFIDSQQYDVRAFGYDPYNAREFVEKWCQENSAYGVEKVIQGVKTESVPLGELKKLAADRLLLFDQEIMKFAMGNCITLEDTNGNRKLMKKRREHKIDAVAAMMDAYVAFKLHREDFE